MTRVVTSTAEARLDESIRVLLLRGTDRGWDLTRILGSASESEESIRFDSWELMSRKFVSGGVKDRGTCGIKEP